MLEAHELLADLIAFFQPKLLAGRHVLLTAGPTSEPVDPVRVLSNRSLQATAMRWARAAHEAGARVTLITAPPRCRFRAA
nr:phosphopantothenoylcysteine decarboxylase [Achromobacter sp. DMS1]